MASEKADKDKIEIVYDGQCPVCTTYCRALPQSPGITLIDARQGGAAVEEATRLGLDIDEGMIVKTDGKVFYGSDAMHELARRVEAPGWAGWMHRGFFNTRGKAGVFYPAAKSVRNVLLRVLGIGKIGNLKQK